MATKKRDLEYEHAVKMYNIVQQQQKDLKAKSDGLKEDIAKLMHADQINEKIIDVDGVKYKANYQGRTNKKINHAALINMIGQAQYSEIVTETRSEFLQIKKAPKGQQTSITNKAPKSMDGKTDLPPVGSLA